MLCSCGERSIELVVCLVCAPNPPGRVKLVQGMKRVALCSPWERSTPFAWVRFQVQALVKAFGSDFPLFFMKRARQCSLQERSIMLWSEAPASNLGGSIG
ncbi:uncharacterized protein DS421_18g622730 [Arachis hypogaea]|nr:uncharacterized protein DS421_18g622730 [Arachis hypogaea]